MPVEVLQFLFMENTNPQQHKRSECADSAATGGVIKEKLWLIYGRHALKTAAKLAKLLFYLVF